MAYQILPADEALLAEIEAWLDAEETNYQRASKDWEDADCEGDHPIRGFRCNWDSAKRGWREGRSKIHVLCVNGKAIGFLDGTDILEINPDHRGNGYGRILAGFMIQSAWEEGRSVIEIEIAPPSAEPFWQHMGFSVAGERQGYGGGNFAYKILPRTFRLETANEWNTQLPILARRNGIAKSQTLCRVRRGRRAPLRRSDPASGTCILLQPAR